MKNHAAGDSINFYDVQGFCLNPEHLFNLCGIFL
jgi:hypothetical protein